MLMIEGITACAGGGHLRVRIAVEGAPTRLVAEVSLDELDGDGQVPVRVVQRPAALTDARAEALTLMCLGWARYRRAMGRAVIGVALA